MSIPEPLRAARVCSRQIIGTRRRRRAFGTRQEWDKGGDRMDTLDRVLAAEISPGVKRRTFLSAGGSMMAGVGALTLPRLGRRLPAGPVAPAVGLPPVYPGDPRYAAMGMGFNRRWAGSPAYIQVVRSASEALLAVQAALRAGRRITVRGGGHCYENFVSGNDGGAIIDLSGMQGISLQSSGQVCVQ